MLDLVPGHGLVKVGRAAVGVHDRLEIRSGSVEERREAEPARVREVLALLERSLHLADARREELGTERSSLEFGPGDGRRSPARELREEVRFPLPDVANHVLGQGKHFGEPQAHRLLEEAGGTGRTNDHGASADGLSGEPELGLADRNGKAQVIDERNLDPVRTGLQGESETAGDLGELLRGDGHQSGVVALRFRNGPAADCRRRAGRGEHEAGEQEREEAHERVGARKLLEVPSAPGVVRGGEDAGATECARRAERRVGEERADRYRLLAE